MTTDDLSAREIELHRAIQPELEPGEAVLWATQPSLRRYVVRRLPYTLFSAGIVIAIYVTSREMITAAIAANRSIGWIVGGLVVCTLLAWGYAIRVRRKTVYAITDRRLLRIGGQSLLNNRPGNTFSYRPEELRFLAISSFGLAHHVYIDRKRWGDGTGNSRVLIGFEDLRNAGAVRDRIRAWLDDFQHGVLSAAADRRAVTNDDYGFRLDVPASWAIAVGMGDDSGTAGASPTEWEHEMHPWEGESRGWNRLRVSGPADAMLAVEVVDAPGRGSDDEVSPTARRALKFFFGANRETRETRFLDMPATLTTWSLDELSVRVLAVPRGGIEYRLHLISRSTMPQLMQELQTIAESFHVTEEGVSRASAGGSKAAPFSSACGST